MKFRQQVLYITIKRLRMRRLLLLGFHLIAHFCIINTCKKLLFGTKYGYPKIKFFKIRTNYFFTFSFVFHLPKFIICNFIPKLWGIRRINGLHFF